MVASKAPIQMAAKLPTVVRWFGYKEQVKTENSAK